MNGEIPPQNQEPYQSPLFHAQHSERYARQALIRDYENLVNCRLIVMIDEIFYDSVIRFEELLYDCSPDTDLHLMINSPGGVGEVAVRLARSAQSRCRELTVIVPDQAKSAATLLALGGHHIIMTPSSDLGPIDPQLFDGREWVAAKDIIATVEGAIKQVQESPGTYVIHALLLNNMTAIMVQQARSALDSTESLLIQALQSNPGRRDEEVQRLIEDLRGPLIESPRSHSALFGPEDASSAGLSVRTALPSSDQWQILWRLWNRYFALGPSTSVYESRTASQIFERRGHINDD